MRAGGSLRAAAETTATEAALTALLDALALCDDDPALHSACVAAGVAVFPAADRSTHEPV